jgi:hypothetical protein
MQTKLDLEGLHQNDCRQGRWSADALGDPARHPCVVEKPMAHMIAEARQLEEEAKTPRLFSQMEGSTVFEYSETAGAGRLCRRPRDARGRRQSTMGRCRNARHYLPELNRFVKRSCRKRWKI